MAETHHNGKLGAAGAHLMEFSQQIKDLDRWGNGKSGVFFSGPALGAEWVYRAGMGKSPGRTAAGDSGSTDGPRTFM